MAQQTQDSPEISALVVIPDDYRTVARTVEALKKQSAADKLELVLVLPVHPQVVIPFDELGMFHSVRTVEMQKLSYAGAMALGVRQARAPIVVMTEDHSFPAPNWAERLIAAHQNEYTVVGPAMQCANSRSMTSLADFFIGYSKWAEPVESGVQDFMMAHNSSYKRDVLLEFGPRLEENLSSETVLQFELAKTGHAFWLEATTYTSHLNFERWGSWIPALVFNGRMFAAQRARDWGIGKRIAYAIASPLIPFVRFLRVRRGVQRSKYPTLFRWRLYLVIAFGLGMDAFGQCLGYAFGQGESDKQAFEFEFHRERHFYVSRASSGE